jgi:hypothetical protein
MEAFSKEQLKKILKKVNLWPVEKENLFFQINHTM